MASPCTARVLVVENDVKAREQLIEILTQPGYKIVAAQGQGPALREDAKRLAASFRPHVVIMDLRLSNELNSSDRSGLELLKEESFSSSRCILHSAYLNVDYTVTIDAFLETRVANVVGKEAPPQKLLDAVEKAARDGCICRREFAIEWPTNWDEERVVQTLFDQEVNLPSDVVTDILGHLYPRANAILLKSLKGSSQVSASVFRGRSVLFQVTPDHMQPFVVKLAPKARTEKEVNAYKECIDNRLRGLYYAQLLDYKVFWELGGICYRFIGSDQDMIETFAASYQAKKSEEIIRPLHHFFVEVWKDHFADTREDLTGNLYSAYDSFLKLSRRLEKVQHREKLLNIPGLPGEFPNPLLWVLEHKDESIIPGAKQAITHGDLHGENLFVEGEHAWAIDFERSSLGPILRDFVELEQDIVIRLVSLPAGNLQLFQTLAITLTMPNKLTEPFNVSWESLDEETRKCLSVIQALRSMAHAMTGCEDIREYYWGLLFVTLFSVLSSENESAKTNRGLIFASLLCSRIGHWGREWPPVEWSWDRLQGLGS